MIKYSIQYTDVVGNEFTCDISNVTYTGPTIILPGSCVLNSAFADEAYGALWGKSLSINVLATIEEPLSDLWQDDEYFWTVTFKKGAQIKFVGYLTSEGVFESYNTDKWELNLEAIGPLGVIKDLAYLQPTTGNPYVGFATLAQVIARILTRGFNLSSERLEIYTFAGINAVNEIANSPGGFFDYANIDQSIFTLDEGETYQDCQLILEELLSSLALSIFQENGKWYILPRHREANATGLAMKVFDADGALLRSETVLNLKTTIGNQIGIDPAPLYHCSENQQLSMRRSVDTFALEHISEYVDQILDNPTIVNDGNTAANWTMQGVGTRVEVGNGGAFLKGRRSNNLQSLITFISDQYQLRENQAFEVRLKTTIIEPHLHLWPVEIILEDSVVNGRTWYYTGDSWTTDAGGQFDRTRAYLESQNQHDVDFVIPLSPLPADGLISINFCEPLFLELGNSTYQLTGNELVILNSCELVPVDGILEGRKRVFKKTDPKRERVKDNEEIRWNTHDDLSLKNVFFEPDLITRISKVKNFGGPFPFNEAQLIYYTTFARALITQRKSLIFTGNVFGEVSFLGAKNYLGISDNMVVLEYRYDTARNITFLKCIEIDQNFTLEGEIINLPIFTTGIKPTIVG